MLKGVSCVADICTDGVAPRASPYPTHLPTHSPTETPSHTPTPPTLKSVDELADAGTDVIADANTGFVADAGTDIIAITGVDINSDAVAICCQGDGYYMEWITTCCSAKTGTISRTASLTASLRTKASQRVV